MKTKHLLVMLILGGLAIRLYPAVNNELNVNFDSIYHARIGQIVAETGWIPSWDYVAGGRPHLYPPLYHLILGYVSLATGLPPIELVKYVLPIASALLALPVFFLIKRYRSESIALLGATFTVFNPIIIAQSYDSPQLFGLLFFPLIVYCFLEGRRLLAGVMLGVCILFNYAISLTIIIVLLVFSLLHYDRDRCKQALQSVQVAAISIIVASPWLLTSLSKISSCFDPTTAVSTLAKGGMENVLLMAPIVAIIGGLVLYKFRERGDGYINVWKAALFIGTAAFIASIPISALHSYDQLLLFGFSLIFLLAELRPNRYIKLGFICLIITASVLIASLVKPPVSQDDIAAIRWVGENVDSATILANPETSGVINTLLRSERIRTEFDLFLECIPDSRRWAEMYEVLATHDSQKAEAILRRYKVDYVIVGSRDVLSYGFDMEKFDRMSNLAPVFSEGDAKIYKVRSTDS